MPQLDQFHYLSQIFWFVLVFLSLYLFIYLYILPTINQILQTRESKINNLKLNKTNASLLESNLIQFKYQSFLVNLYKLGITLVNQVKTDIVTFNIKKVNYKLNSSKSIVNINKSIINRIYLIQKFKYLLK